MNPETTGERGLFAWEAVEGSYAVEATRPGCGTAVTSTFPIPPPVDNLQIVLHCDHLFTVEQGVCIKAVGGKYGNSACTEENAKSEGEYEWEPGVLTEFTGGGLHPVLTSTLGKLECSSFASRGEKEGEVDEAVITLEGCELLGKKVTTKGQKEGTIKTEPLERRLCLDNAGEVFVELEADPGFYSATLETLSGGTVKKEAFAEVTIEGTPMTVTGIDERIAPLSVIASEFDELYTNASNRECENEGLTMYYPGGGGAESVPIREEATDVQTSLSEYEIRQ